LTLFTSSSSGSKAADQVRRDQYNQHGRSASGEGQWIKGTRYSLLKDTAKQTVKALLKLAEVVLTNEPMYRGEESRIIGSIIRLRFLGWVSGRGSCS
jgi:hypothetical protein